MGLPSIDPLPPVAAVALPWDELVAEPVAALAAARAAHGDTFVVDSGGDRYLFLFSPEGVRSLYATGEDVASKGVADWRMLRRKLPDELFRSRRTYPHELFGRHDVAGYLGHLVTALDTSVAELGTDGEVEVFGFARRLAHRMGLASWAGPGSGRGERFEALVATLDALDASDAFVRPDLMAEVAASDKRVERQALAAAVDLVGAALAEHDAAPAAERRRDTEDATGDGGADLFTRIASR